MNIPTKGWDSEKRYKFTNNDQNLFLPAAGYINGTLFDAVGYDGYYWSGNVYTSKIAYNLRLQGSDVRAHDTSARSLGYPVRPVRVVTVPATTTTEGYNEENDFVW